MNIKDYYATDKIRCLRARLEPFSSNIANQTVMEQLFIRKLVSKVRFQSVAT